MFVISCDFLPEETICPDTVHQKIYFLNIIFRIPGLWVTEAWIFLYLKNKSLSLFHCNSYNTTDEDLLFFDKRRNQSTQPGIPIRGEIVKTTGGEWYILILWHVHSGCAQVVSYFHPI